MLQLADGLYHCKAGVNLLLSQEHSVWHTQGVQSVCCGMCEEGCTDVCGGVVHGLNPVTGADCPEPSLTPASAMLPA